MPLQAASDKITRSKRSPREKRLGIESVALPSEAPNELITLWPEARS